MTIPLEKNLLKCLHCFRSFWMHHSTCGNRISHTRMYVMRTTERRDDKSFIVREDTPTQYKFSSSTSIRISNFYFLYFLFLVIWFVIELLFFFLCIFSLLDFWFLLGGGLCNPNKSRKYNFVAYIKARCIHFFKRTMKLMKICYSLYELAMNFEFSF